MLGKRRNNGKKLKAELACLPRPTWFRFDSVDDAATYLLNIFRTHASPVAEAVTPSISLVDLHRMARGNTTAI